MQQGSLYAKALQVMLIAAMLGGTSGCFTQALWRDALQQKVPPAGIVRVNDAKIPKGRLAVIYEDDGETRTVDITSLTDGTPDAPFVVEGHPASKAQAWASATAEQKWLVRHFGFSSGRPTGAWSESDAYIDLCSCEYKNSDGLLMVTLQSPKLGSSDNDGHRATTQPVIYFLIPSSQKRTEGAMFRRKVNAVVLTPLAAGADVAMIAASAVVLPAFMIYVLAGGHGC